MNTQSLHEYVVSRCRPILCVSLHPQEAVSRLHDEAESLPTSSSKDTSEGSDKSKGDTKPSGGVKKRSQLSLIAGSIKTKRKR